MSTHRCGRNLQRRSILRGVCTGRTQQPSAWRGTGPSSGRTGPSGASGHTMAPLVAPSLSPVAWQRPPVCKNELSAYMGAYEYLGGNGPIFQQNL